MFWAAKRSLPVSSFPLPASPLVLGAGSGELEAIIAFEAFDGSCATAAEGRSMTHAVSATESVRRIGMIVAVTEVQVVCQAHHRVDTRR